MQKHRAGIGATVCGGRRPNHPVTRTIGAVTISSPDYDPNPTTNNAALTTIHPG